VLEELIEVTEKPMQCPPAMRTFSSAIPKPSTHGRKPSSAMIFPVGA
jgi:hypothetical protein